MKKSIDQLLEQLKESQTQLTDWLQAQASFIPLTGCYNSSYKGGQPLDGELNTFFAEDNQTVLLLAGHSGAGKSVVTQRFIISLWGKYKPGNPIPLWISLPSCKNPEKFAVQEVLEKIGFDNEQINHLKTTQQFIIVLDAYDEIRCLKNLYVTNKLNEWNAKVIITCRHEYLYNLDSYKNLFTPYDNNKPNYEKSVVMYVKPFSVDQIAQYVRKHLKNNPDAEWNSWAHYEKAIEEIPGLKTLVENPYVLTLAVAALPVISKRYVLIEDDAEKKDLTRAVLYDVFVDQWFTRQEKKLKANQTINENEDIKPQLWDYAKRLAQCMHEHHLTQIYYDPVEEDDLFGSEEDDNPFAEFFDYENPKIPVLQSSCLIREVSPKQYGFLHRSLLEYFLTRNLFDALKDEALPNKIAEEKNLGEDARNKKTKPKKNKDYFNERLLVGKEQVIQFLTDRVNDEERFKQELLTRLYSSKNNPDNKVGAANGITILVKAGVTFNGADLSGVQIPGADISGGYFDQAKFQGSDLSQVSAVRTWLRCADMSQCRWAGFDFGEMPWLAHDAPISVMYNSRFGGDIAVAVGHSVVIYEPGDCAGIYDKKQVFDHNDPVNGVVLIWTDGKDYCITGSGQELRLWDVKSGECVDTTSVGYPVMFIVRNFHSKTFFYVKLPAISYIYEVFIVDTPPYKAMKTSFIEELKSMPNALAVLGGYRLEASHRMLHGYIDCILKHSFAHTDELTACVKSAKGDVIAGDQSGNIVLWRSKHETDSAIIIPTGQQGAIHHLLVTSDSNNLVVINTSGVVQWWAIQSWTLLGSFQCYQGKIQSALLDQFERNLLTGGENGTVRVWPVDHVQEEKTAFMVDRDMTSTVVHPMTKMLISVGGDEQIECWRLYASEIKRLRTIKATREIVTVALSPDGDHIVCGARDGVVQILHCATGELVLGLQAHEGLVTGLHWCRSGKILSSGYDGRVVIYQEQKLRQQLKIRVLFEKHAQPIWDFVVSEDGQYVVIGRGDGTLCMKSVTVVDSANEEVIKAHSLPVYRLLMRVDGQQLVSCDTQGELKVWLMHERTLIEQRTLRHPHAMTLVHNGAGLLVTGGLDGVIREWDETGECRGEIVVGTAV